MIKSIHKFVELRKEGRNILNAGYKNIISDKRASWGLLNNRKKKKKKNSPKTVNISKISQK